MVRVMVRANADDELSDYSQLVDFALQRCPLQIFLGDVGDARPRLQSDRFHVLSYRGFNITFVIESTPEIVMSVREVRGELEQLPEFCNGCIQITRAVKRIR